MDIYQKRDFFGRSVKIIEAVDVNSWNAGIPFYLWMLLFLMFLVIAFIGLVIYTSRKETPHAPSYLQKKELELLKEQYVNGEISEEEYQERMKKLKKQSTR